MLVQAELPGTELLAPWLHLQADCRGAVLLAGFARLDGDTLPEVNHSIRGQGVDGRQDGGVCVLVGVGQPGLLRDAEAGGSLRGRPRRVVGRIRELLVGCCPTAIEAVLSLARGGGPGTSLAHPVVISHAGARGSGGGVARGSASSAALTRQSEGGTLG